MMNEAYLKPTAKQQKAKKKQNLVLVIAPIPASYQAECAVCSQRWHRAVHHLACSFVRAGRPRAAPVSLELVNMRVGLSERPFFVNAVLMTVFHGALSCEWLLNPLSPGLVSI